jgi:hypothetical protein
MLNWYLSLPKKKAEWVDVYLETYEAHFQHLCVLTGAQGLLKHCV